MLGGGGDDVPQQEHLPSVSDKEQRMYEHDIKGHAKSK